MKPSLLPSILLACCCSGSMANAESRIAPPNIIVIYTDDQGFGDASCLNPDAKFKTPNIDRIAKEGISFTNAHSSSAVCTPSRYSLLTGRYCWRTTLKRHVLGAEAPCLITDDRMTLASLLRGQGYHTGMVGKWHLGMDFPGTKGDRDWSQPTKDMPLDKGFDYFYGIPASMNFGVLAWFEGRHPKTPPTLFTNKKPNDRHSDYRIMPPYQSSPEETKKELGTNGMEVAADFIDNQCLTRFTDKAIEWMRSKEEDVETGKNFFLYLAYTSPHFPVCPLPEFQGQGDCGAYGEFLIETDHHVGRILSYLEQSGLADDTMIIFTSDNGPAGCWKQNRETYAHRSNHIYRGGKTEIYEGGHRVPFLIRWPNGISNPGRSWDKPIGQVDLLATLADIVGAKLPANAGEDSQSFLTLLLHGEAIQQRMPLISHSVKGRFAITQDEWKLILPEKGTNQGFELYNLSKDPGETNNLTQEHPAKTEELLKMITTAVLNGRTSPGPQQANDTGYWEDLTWITAEQYQQAQSAPTRERAANTP